MKNRFKALSVILSLAMLCGILPFFSVSLAEANPAEFVGSWKQDYGEAYILYTLNEDGSLQLNFFETGNVEPIYGYEGTWSAQDGNMTLTYTITFYSQPDMTETLTYATEVSGDLMTITYEGQTITLNRIDASSLLPQYSEHATCGSLFIAYTDDPAMATPVHAADGSIPLVLSFGIDAAYIPGSSDNLLSITSGGMQAVAACHGPVEGAASIESTVMMAENAAARYGGEHSVSYSGVGDGFIQAVYSGTYPSSAGEYPFMGVMLALENELEYFSLEYINTSLLPDAEFKEQFLMMLDRLTYNGDMLILGDRRKLFEMRDYSLLMPDGWSPIALSDNEANINGKGYMRFYDYSEFDRGLLANALAENGGYSNMEALEVIQKYLDSTSVGQFDSYHDTVRQDITFTNGQACVILAGKDISSYSNCSAYAILANESGILLIAHQYQYYDDTHIAVATLNEIISNAICGGEQLIIGECVETEEPVYDDSLDFYW